MSEKVQGKHIDFFVLYSGSYYPVICSTSFTRTRNTEMLPTTSYTSGKHRQFRPRLHDYTLSITGVTTLDTDPGAWAYMDSCQDNDTLITYKVVITSDDNTTTFFTGTAYIQTATLVGDVTAYSEFTLELQGSGGIVFDGEVDPGTGGTNSEDVKTYIFSPGSSPQTSHTASELMNRTILLAWRDQTKFKKIITSGTPTELQLKHNPATGEISWLTATEPGEEITVLHKG